MVMLGGPENYVQNCTIGQKAYNSVDPTVPTGCTGIVVQPTGGGAYVANMQIYSFDIGIKILGAGVNLLHGFFSNIHCESNINAVLIQPLDSNGKAYQVFFDDCVFARCQNAPAISAGVLIDPNGGSISDIFFNNCMCHSWAGPGMQIMGGQDIVVTGGRYGSNATDASMATSGGIAVTGSAVRVSIVGADCSGQIPSYQSQPPGSAVQPYGISVTGTVTGMQVAACNLTNNGTGPLYAPTNGTDLWVTDCRGYNDQVKQLTTFLPATGARFNGGTYGYYGPSTFYITSGASAIKVSYSGSTSVTGITTGLTSGAFRLDPGEWGEIDYSGVIGSFVLVGT
jgi:hypothetical protein